jgi:O-antigen/teichoic acid export membrane protein
VEKIIFYTSKYFLVIAIPLFFGLSVLSERLLLLLTTPEIASNGYFITPFVILGLFSFGFYQISGQIIILQKKTTIIGITWVIAAVINFAGNLIFIPALGILGAALTTLFAYLLAGMITLYFSSKFIKIRVDYSVLFKSIVASLLFSIMLVLIPTTEYLDTLAIILVSIVMYFGLMFAMKAFTQNEIHFFRDLLNVQFF